MTIDLNLFPTTFDVVHAGLAATVVGLLFILVLISTIAIMMIWSLSRSKKPAPVAAPEPVQQKPVKAAEVKSAPVKTETVILREATPDAACQLLSLLQNEARFIDFTQENIQVYSDADIGAAARVVHEGCAKVLRQNFDLEAIRSESEGSRLSLPKGFDAASVRLTGNIIGEAPFTGTLVHKGWRVKNIKLPKLTEGHDAKIIQAAEVEL